MDIKKEQRIVFNISGSKLNNKHKDNKNIPWLRVGSGESAVFNNHSWVGGVRVGVADSGRGGFGWGWGWGWRIRVGRIFRAERLLREAPAATASERKQTTETKSEDLSLTKKLTTFIVINL